MKINRLIRTIVFCGICVLISNLLTWALEPNTIARLDLHNINSKKYDDIFIGTSHGLNAIHPQIVDSVTGRKSTNLCLPNEFLIDSYYLLKESCRNQKLSRVIYQLDVSYWCTKENEGENAIYIYNQYPFSIVKMEYFFDKIAKLDIRCSLAPWVFYRNSIKYIPENIKLKLSQQYRNYQIHDLNTADRFFTTEGSVYQMPIPTESKGTPDIVRWNSKKFQKSELQNFKKIIKLCKKKGIELIVITTPVPFETREKYRSDFREADLFFEKLMKQYDVKYKNFSNLPSGVFDDSMNGYVDFEGHMNGELGEKFSVILGEYLAENDKDM